jgi:hypothetical protein
MVTAEWPEVSPEALLPAGTVSHAAFGAGYAAGVWTGVKRWSGGAGHTVFISTPRLPGKSWFEAEAWRRVEEIGRRIDEGIVRAMSGWGWKAAPEKVQEPALTTLIEQVVLNDTAKHVVNERSTDALSRRAHQRAKAHVRPSPLLLRAISRGEERRGTW